MAEDYSGACGCPLVPDGRASHHGRSALGEQAQSALIVVLVPVVAANEALMARACHERDCAMQEAGSKGQAKIRSRDRMQSWS